MGKFYVILLGIITSFFAAIALYFFIRHSENAEACKGDLVLGIVYTIGALLCFCAAVIIALV